MKIILLLMYKIVQITNSDVYSVYSNALGRYQRKRISSMEFMNFVERLAIGTDSLPTGTTILNYVSKLMHHFPP